MKKTIILLATIVLLQGCGDSSTTGTKEEQMRKKDGILILKGYPKDLCKTAKFLTIFKDVMPLTKNNLIMVKDDTIGCDFYNRDKTHKDDVLDSLKGGLKNVCSVVDDIDDFQFNDKEYELSDSTNSCVLGVDWSLLGL